MRTVRILATCYDYRPGLGGIATVGHKLLEALDARDDVAVRAISPVRPGDVASDTEVGLDVRRVAMGTRPLGSVLPYARAVRQELREWSPDLVLNFLWLPDGVGTWLAMRGTGIPYAVFAHAVEVLESDWSFRKRVRRRLAPVKRRVFRDAVAALPVSNFTAKALEGFGVSRAQMSLIYGGVDPGEFAPRPKPAELLARHRLGDARVFLSVCRLHPYKGVDVALAGFAQVAAEHPDAVYVVCGDGPDRSRLERLVAEHRLAGRVIFTGAVPQSELPGYYNLADTFVLVPREELWVPEAEGFGLVFLEAAASGTRVIAGRSGGVEDAAGEQAWMVPPDDPAAVAAAMRAALAETPAERAARSLALRERAVEQFSWTAMAETVVALAAGRTAVEPVARRDREAAAVA